MTPDEAFDKLKAAHLHRAAMRVKWLATPMGHPEALARSNRYAIAGELVWAAQQAVQDALYRAYYTEGAGANER